jgi:hypothetical protein
MAFLVPSIQFFFSLPRALFCFGIHFNAILGNVLITFISSKWLSHSKCLQHSGSSGSHPVTRTDKFVNYLKTSFRLQGLYGFEQNHRMIM